MHWNEERQPHKGIFWTKVLIFQDANSIFDVGSLSIVTISKEANMRKLYKHEKTVILLGIIGLILIGISLCPGGWESATGILQGLSTGLWSGIILFFINGIKSREVKELAEIYDTIHQSNLALIIISDAYSDIYHKTYHGKKEEMSFEFYLNIVKETFNEYIRSRNMISRISIDLIPNEYIREDMNKYIHYLDKEIFNIQKEINNINQDDRERLDKLRENFYDIQYEAYVLRSTSLIFEKEIYAKKTHLDSSLI